MLEALTGDEELFLMDKYDYIGLPVGGAMARLYKLDTRLNFQRLFPANLYGKRDP